MVSSSGDDRDTSRKKRQTKRDCAEVVAEHPQDESGVSCEKTRKVRKYSPTTDNDKSTSNNNAASSAAESATAKTEMSSNITTNVTTKNLTSSPQESSTAKKVKTTTSATQTTTTSELSSSNKENPPVVENQDLESALSYVASIGEGRTESLSSDATLSFRVGHAGDASTLANWYKKSMASRNNNPDNHHPDGEKSQEIINSESPSKPDKSASADDSPLELWLVDGLGDEGIPPSLFALIADVSSTTKKN
ncbi:expressed unknown protein [Seminavis robusta]|uniref:Uncharacterized protein n=1 Tax=Seminavis robusta TaxID=568900 RepID=A0A9N8HVJ1_9STRA|nr:expressed unknown protein [Seminavis robusta]|eukprot:Sro1954_g307620.1 n/a (250) ;mRNA; r:6852-7601